MALWFISIGIVAYLFICGSAVSDSVKGNRTTAMHRQIDVRSGKVYLEEWKAANPKKWQTYSNLNVRWKKEVVRAPNADAVYKELLDEAYDRVCMLTGQKLPRFKVDKMGTKPHEWEFIRCLTRYYREWAKSNGVDIDPGYIKTMAIYGGKVDYLLWLCDFYMNHGKGWDVVCAEELAYYQEDKCGENLAQLIPLVGRIYDVRN